MAIAPAYRRIAGIVTTLAVIVVSLVGAGLVMAASAGYAEDGQRVEFSGGSQPALHLCRSRPGRPRITVWAGVRVTFVNRLGQPAMLRIDGRDMVLVGVDEAAPVVFQRGPASVSMVLLCASGAAEQFEAVTVTVAAAAPGATPGASAGQISGAGQGDSAGQVGGPVKEPSTWSGVAVEPVRARSAAAEPHRASGLLAAVATVAVAGVTIAAIRTIITTRTTRVFFSQVR